MSDNDSGGEVREKLQKTTIEPASTAKLQPATPANPKTSAAANEEEDSPSSDASSAARKSRPLSPKRKRGSEEPNASGDESSVGNAESESEEDDKNSGRESRKRARAAVDEDVTGRKDGRASTPPSAENGPSIPREAIASPKGKRRRDDFAKDKSPETETLDGIVAAAKLSASMPVDVSSSSGSDEDGERSRKRKREASLPLSKAKPKPANVAAAEPASRIKSPVKLTSTSGFGNASASSPFATLNSPPKKPAATVSFAAAPQAASTSQAAFESSGFGKLAKSATSAFGSLGASASASPFGGLGAGPATFASSPFAAASSTSANRAPSSGFGGLSGFGGASSSPWASAAGKPSVFTSTGKPPPISGLSTITKPFGAPAAATEDDDEEASDDEGSDEDTEDNTVDGETSAALDNHAPKPPKTPLKSGEEDEHTFFQNRAKLYQFTGTEWKECGSGVLKLNVTRFAEDPQDITLEDLHEEAMVLEEAEFAKAHAEMEAHESDEAGEGLIIYSKDSSAAKEEANSEEKVDEESSAAEKTKDEESKDEPSDHRRRARFILRAEGSGRLVLNSSLSRSMPFGGDAKGARPTGMTVLFQGTLVGAEGSELSSGARKLTLKMKQSNALDLWRAVEILKRTL